MKYILCKSKARMLRLKGRLRKLKHKLVKPLERFKIAYCDWCDTLSYDPYTTEYSEDVCKSCKDDASWCEGCEEIVHPEMSVDMPEGWYCQDCYDSMYG